MKKKKLKIHSLLILLLLAFTIFIQNSNTPQTAHALASWNPITGFQPGIGIDVPGTNPGWDLPIVNPGTIINPTNADGSLKSYSSLRVKNDKYSKTYKAGWKHMQFVEYFEVKRTDDRPIYDDDGIIDVKWWNSNGEFGYSDELVNYPAELWIKTQVAEHNWKGFLSSMLNSKFSSGAKFYLTFDRGEDAEEVLSFNVHDKNSNTMGSGNYRNNGVNPGDEFYKLADIVTHNNLPYSSKSYITVEFNGQAYWENAWWGGSYDHTQINDLLTGFIPVDKRSWENYLTYTDESIKAGSYNGRTAYYSHQPFVVTATNLNNYIKLNDTQITPITNESVIPFKEGFKIAITDEGATKVSLEHSTSYGIQNAPFVDYYAVVDTQIPDVSLGYLNTNGMDKMTNSEIINTNGIKSQTHQGGVFRDQVQIEFGASAGESPERATYTLNGKTYNLTSGTWLTQNGDYTVVVKDFVGHSKTIKFTIDTISPSQNLINLQNDKNFKISKWFLAKIPYGFNGYGNYSFATYNEALHLANNLERQNLVTSHYLSNVNDFKHTNLVAENNQVKVGNYWYYKSKNNANLYVYYFDENNLKEVIEHYAKQYITEANYFNYHSDLFPNDYGNNISQNIYHNIWNEYGTAGYIANNFTFRYYNDLENYKIYYDYQEDNINEYKGLLFNVPFKNQVNKHGLYKIKEIDYVGHETFYYVFLDLEAPKLEVTAKVYGSNYSFNHSVSINDIPQNDELIYYYESFNINEVLDDDTWWVLQIKTPNNQNLKYTHLDNIPSLESLGSGEFNISVYDRLKNKFDFKVYIVGKAPTVTFENINANTQMKITIKPSESYNTILDLKIYRNDVLLNSEIGYDEYPEREDNELIFISPTKLNYTFNKGGVYVVEVTDNFGRTLAHEYRFEKDLPKGVLIGVAHNGQTKNQVQFKFNNSKYFIVVKENNINFEFESVKENDLTTVTFTPKTNSLNKYQIILYDISDFENYNIYNFDIKTITPTLHLIGATDGGKTASNVYATWETVAGLSAEYSFDFSSTLTYRKGQVLSNEGKYKIKLSDELGNFKQVEFEIDRTLDFTIFKGTQIADIEDIRYSNQNILIKNDEDLNIEVLKDNESYDYVFNTYLTDEGTYLIKIFDNFGNNKYFYTTIDKTPPTATLNGVENYGSTNSQVNLTWEENNINAYLYFNDKLAGNYVNGSPLNTSGNYKIILQDLAKNQSVFEFRIDNEIIFEINTFNGGISNGNVRIISKENLVIDMQKDGQKIDYNFEEILNEEGSYFFTLKDEFNNEISFSFKIINKPKQRFEHYFNENIELVNVIQNEEIIEENYLDGNKFTLIDEGNYLVEVKDNLTNKNYSFVIMIDTTAPTIELVGVENGGLTKINVSTKNPSESPIYTSTLRELLEYEYEIGQEIEKPGQYKITVSDEAGNKTIYTFTKVYSMNGASIALIAGMLAVVVVIIAIFLKSRNRLYKEQVVEEIEEVDEIAIE